MRITTPNENKDVIDNKPFCCKFCGSEQLIKAGGHPKNQKQYYLCKVCSIDLSQIDEKKDLEKSSPRILEKIEL